MRLSDGKNNFAMIFFWITRRKTMKKRVFLCRILPCISVILSAVSCKSLPQKTEEKVAPVVPDTKTVKSPAEKAAAPVMKKSAVSPGMQRYLAALKEKEKDRRTLLFKEARLLLEKEIAESSKDSRNKDILRTHLLLGKMADAGFGMTPDGILAAKHYRIAADRGLDEAKLALAKFWLSRQILQEDAFKQICSIPGYEKNPDMLFLLGMIRYTQMQHEEGFTLFKKSLALSSRPGDLLRVRKVLLTGYEMFFKARNYDGAYRELQKLLSLEKKEDFLLYFHLGLVESRRKNPRKAEEYFNKALTLNPAFPFTYRELAFLAVQDKRNEEALDHIKVAYAVSGRDSSMLSGVIDICTMTGNYRTLLRILSSRKEVQKEAALELCRLRATLHLILKEYEAAYRELDLLLKEPAYASSTAVLEGMAVASTYLGKLAVARTMYEKILQKSFQVVPGMNLAELYVVENQYEKALTLLSNEAFKSRGDVTAKCVVPYLKATALLASGREKEAALQILEFEKMLRLYQKENRKDWDVHLFRTWLQKNKTLSGTARKEIMRMTDLISGKILLHAEPSAGIPVGKSASVPVNAPEAKPVKK